jgi:pimeloyl-ACP methyl ester carboxylesterase
MQSLALGWASPISAELVAAIGRSGIKPAQPIATMQQFTAESPLPVQADPYDALCIFWGYNVFKRRSGPWHLNIPALIISGGQDPMFNEAMGANLASYFPDSKHLHLENTGHLIMPEDPNQINQAVAKFRQNSTALT